MISSSVMVSVSPDLPVTTHDLVPRPAGRAATSSSAACSVPPSRVDEHRAVGLDHEEPGRGAAAGRTAGRRSPRCTGR